MVEILDKQIKKSKISYDYAAIIIVTVFSLCLRMIGDSILAILPIVLVLIGIGIIGYKNPESFIIILILFKTRVFCFMPTHILGGVQFSILEVLVTILAYLVWAFKGFRKKNNIKPYLLVLLTSIVLMVISSIVANNKIGQSIVLGFSVQSRLLVPLIVFPVVSLLKNINNALNKIVVCINTIALIFSILLICQMLFTGKYDFMIYDSSFERAGRLRISTGAVVLVIDLFILINRILKKISIKTVLQLFLVLYVLIFIVQGRMALLGAFSGSAFAFLYNNCTNLKKKYKIALCLVLVLGLFIIVSKDQLFELINLTSNEISSSSGNYGARIAEKEFYLQQVDMPFWGRGYVTPKTEAGALLDSKYNYYSITDIGITGLYVTNGIVGLLWFGAIAITICMRCKHLHRIKIDVFLPFAYLFYALTITPSLLTFYYDPEVLSLIFIVLYFDNKKIVL